MAHEVPRRRRAPRRGGGWQPARRARPTLRAAEATGLLLVALLLAVSVLGYDKGLYASYWLSRLAPLFVLAAALLVVWALTLNGREPVRVDLVDALAVVAVVWLVVGAVASPAPAIAWLGYYNRGTGVLFSAAVLALFLAARRLLRGRACLLAAGLAGRVALARRPRRPG